MKRNISSIWLILLIVATAIVSCWTVFLFALSKMMLYDSNADVSKSMTEQQRDHMFTASTGLLRLELIPMVVLIVMWMLAFVSERREHNKLRRQLGQPAAGGYSPEAGE